MVALLLWRRNALVTLINRRVRAARASAVPGPIGDEEVTVEERVERAAAYVHDALAGRFRGVHWAVWAAPLRCMLSSTHAMHACMRVQAEEIVCFMSVRVHRVDLVGT